VVTRVPEAALHAFHVRDLRAPGAGPAARQVVRIPVILDAPVPPMRMVDGAGRPVAFSLVEPEGLPGGHVFARLLVPMQLEPGESRELSLVPAPDWPAPPVVPPESLANERVRVGLDDAGGLRSLSLDGIELAGEGFLAPFLSYRTESKTRVYPAVGWRRVPLDGERHAGLMRARLQSRIPFRTPDGAFSAGLRVDLTVPDAAPWLVADVTVEYPLTVKRDLRSNMQQKLRRYLDLRWVEVAPFPLRPRLDGSRAAPLRVWKRNWLGVTSSFPLDYARINPKNAELDAFNHQVTAGWLAVGDGKKGLLLAQSSDVRTSYAFAPMRLWEQDGRQQLQLNPFGTYHGEQLDYSHLGGTGIGTEFTNLSSNALRPNGPSYNGEAERFALLIAPFVGDAPPPRLQADADTFYRPPAVVYMRTLAPEVHIPADIRARVAAGRLERARDKEGPLPELRAFLVNPSAGAVDVVWDEPADGRVSGYELEWRPASEEAWRSVLVLGPARRHHLSGLEDGRAHAFRLRAVGPGEPGAWTPAQEVVPGPVAEQAMVAEAAGASWWLLLRTFGWGLVHWLTTP
ncbi:MAG: fibronectin type III domain-containing protein, partial [Myxococcota bacterium]